MVEVAENNHWRTTTGASIIPAMDSLADLLGQAPAIVALREEIRRIVERTTRSPRLPPILLQGETGTGKSLVARLIHQAGARSAGPFIDVNCAAIPEGLLEAELFGFERGAFTDARQPKPGLFQCANAGTIFLDEISLLSPALQAKLLTVIEERVVRRLGSTRPEPVDVSIITAANEDLGVAVDARRFRQDLYHRLAVLTVSLPPLRERCDDIPILADHFLARACKDYGLPSKILTPAARACLRAYSWPGNVRELANVMERVALLTDTAHLGPESLQLPTKVTPVESRVAVVTATGGSLGDRLEAWEREELLRALDETRGNVVRAAARLGITRGTIRYRIAKYDLQPLSSRARRRRAPSTPPERPPRAAVLPALAATRWQPRLIALLEATLRPLQTDGASADFSRDLDVVVEKIESFAGRIEEAGPARIVAAFGIDPAEDAPRRAALAAMAMLNACLRVRPVQARRVGVTIAIHADQCPVAEVGGRARIDEDAKRQAVLVLAELRARWEPDAILVSETARSFLGRRFDFAEPADDWPSSAGHRLLGYQPHRFGVGGHPGPFVGREYELETLRSRWRDARQSQGQIVALVGEPGIGKSRLLSEFVRALDDESLTYLEGRGESYGGGIPYLPVIDFLKGYFRIDDRDDPAATGDRVTTWLRALDPALSLDASPLLALLGAPSSGPEWPALEPVQRRQRTLDALTRFVLRLGHAQPVLLAIEDLHWIDTETQAFLDRLVLRLPAARLLVLVSYRPEYTHTWGSKSSYTQLRLGPLGAASVEHLVRDLVGDDVALQPLTRLLVERTEGNPFFLEESVRILIETRGLVGQRGAYQTARDLRALEVPPTVRAVLTARIDRLPLEDRQLLQTAAVVGKDVPAILLRAIADVPDSVLWGVLGNLQAAEFLHETRLLPEVEYTFKHALTHDVAYAGLHPDRRRALHARMVAALERFYPDRLTEQVERLAHHALAAESWPQALAYCRQAGTKAAWRSAHREAVSYFEHALRAIRQLPESRGTSEEILDIYFQLRWSLVPLGEYTMLAESLRQAATLAESLGDASRLGEISQSMTNYLRLVGDCDGALDAGRRGCAIGAALGNRVLEIRTTYQLGMVYRQLGDYEHAIPAYRTVVDFLRGDLILERFGEPSVLSVHARTWLATSLAEVGRFSDGLANGTEAIEIAERAKNAFSLTNAHLGLGMVYARRGDVGPAIPLLERSLSLCRDGNFTLLLPHGASALGAAFTLAGRVKEALPLLELAVDTAHTKGLMGSFSLYLARLGEAKLAARQIEEASAVARRALEAARKYKERGHEAWALYLLGEVAAAGDSAEVATAARHFGEAMAVARLLGMAPLIAQCHGQLGRLDGRIGQTDRAREHQRQAATMFGEMDMRFWREKMEDGGESTAVTMFHDERGGGA
jgi:DNA-binding NtrC family response regulator/tetratricopeptide (TPR) repeat protein